jgi:hypothetical protein
MSRHCMCDQCGRELGLRAPLHIDYRGSLSGYVKDFCDEFCLLRWTINHTAELVDAGIRPRSSAVKS